MRALPIILISMFLLSACSKLTSDLSFLESPSEIITSESGKSCPEGIRFNSDYQIGQPEIDAYVKYKQMTATKECPIELEFSDPLVGINGEIVAYTLKFNNGWEIIAADKRAPCVLVSGMEADYNMSEWNPGAQMWASSLIGEEMILMTSPEKYPTEASKEAKDKIDAAVDFWDAIMSTESFVERHHPQTRSGINDQGYWELVDVEEEVQNENVIHLLNTHWHQHSPYNSYIPYKSDWSERAPAGCVGVAGAQMLYYLHNLIGRPIEAPYHGFCSGDINNYVNDGLLGETGDWSLLNPAGDLYCAILVTRASKALHTVYGNNESTASNPNFVDSLFAPLGISCIESSYSPTTVMEELLLDKPSIINAFGGMDSFLGFSWFTDGHTFIIDAGRCTRTKRTYHYIWHYGPGDPFPLDEPPTRVVVTYTTPSSVYFRMNWGWGEYFPYPDPEFAATGNWEIDKGEGIISNYIFDREMIHSFAAIN